MSLASERPPTGYALEGDADTLVIKAIAVQAILLFVQDCQDLISSDVRTSIAQQANSPLELVRKHGISRAKALKAWLKARCCLAWGVTSGGRGVNYANLMLILSDQPEAPLKQLQHAEESWTPQVLARHFVQIGLSPDPTASAPISKSGSFLTALPIALELMKRKIPDKERAQSIMIKMFAALLKLMQIQFVPWKKPSQSMGSHTRAVRADHWMIIRHVAQATIQIPTSITLETQMEVLAEQAADNNIYAPWSMPSRLHEMGNLWKKLVLPHDWNRIHASLDPLRTKPDSKHVIDTYEYVEQNFDGNRWIHHLSLILGIMFSRVTPTISLHKKDIVISGTTPQAITESVRRLPWIIGTAKCRKGFTAPKPFVTMVTTALIGYLDPISPFAIYLHKSGFIQGPAWTGKHGE